ncbi:MAG: NADH-quinone oxidoreductase subunit NuoH [Verrucomicrobiota bacterium]|nr:NADH-quinone oxidoreductase subunit NuoH [Limisphaera sp.]MDW8382490.1 NADH-quinone oxidoreductase subunit NuoH [Verrucomicrobiota bacterium]
MGLVRSMMNSWGQLEPVTQQALLTLVRAVGAFAVLMFLVSYVVLIERRVCAWIQDRLGPNRCGPFGLLQPAADAIKAFLKEDFTPAHVRRVLFTLAPALVMLPAILNLAVIPFGSAPGTASGSWVVADLNVGLVYVFGILSLSVYGIVLAGYASNSRYPLLGGLRSGAQLISYEVLMGLSAVPVFLWVGSLNLSEILAAQTGRLQWAPSWLPLPNWLALQSPMLLLSLCLFLVAALAETNRTPFDLPEAEQELAGGYNIEYSSMRFALFFMGEYAAMILAAALMTTLFFGGWTLPWWGLDRPAQTFLGGLLHVGIFLAKVLALLLVFIWVRWMWPRFRYDQLMRLSWCKLIPLALLNILITAIWLWWQSL